MIFEPQIGRAPNEQSRFQPEIRSRLQRKCACGGTPGSSGECEECKLKRMQAKLAVNSPGDQFEQEADRMAEFVVSGWSGAARSASLRDASSPPRPVQKSTPLQNTCDEVRQPVLRKASGQSASVGAAPPIVHEVLESSWQPLDDVTRGLMESRLAYNFSGVRIHADAKAGESARVVNALAYTVGRDVVFGAGQYAPASAQGKRLLAHELAHTAQQGSARNLRRVRDRAACPERCMNCPADGVLPEGCECFGVERPKMVVPATTKIRIVRLSGASSESTIKRDLKQANRIWQMAGIEVEAEIHSISQEATEKILGTDDKGRLKKNVMIEPVDTALNSDSTRALLGLSTSSGNEKFSVAAGNNVHSLVVYYVPEFNRCAAEDKAIGCAFQGTHGGRYFVLIEKVAQDVALAHELGHMWGNEHVSSKRNLMFRAAARGGLDADQIKTARETLKLGNLRCLATGASAGDRERIETEQQSGQSLVRSITGEWAGTVTVNGEDRDSRIQFRVDSKNLVSGAYWYETASGKQPGRIMNGVVAAGVLNYDWEQGSGPDQSKGRGSFSLVGADQPPRLTGRWGVAESLSNGGAWSIQKAEMSEP